MKQILVNILFWFAKSFGIFKFFRFIYQNKVTIIVYHNPVPELFEKHLKYMIKYFHIISLSEFVTAVREEKYSQLPGRSLIITIDDGHKNNYYLLPLIKKYKITPTIYLVSDIVCTNRKFWWSIPNSKKEIALIKTLSNKEKNLYLFKKYNFSLDKEFSFDERSALSKNEIIEMNPFVDFQSHTCFHPILTRCSDEELIEELLLSKQKLETLLNKKIKHISYPNGDFNANVISKVKSFGYLSARSTNSGHSTKKSGLYRLKIVGVSETNIKHRLELDLLGIPLLIINLYRKLYHFYNKIIFSPK